MGARGPAPLPTELRIATGNRSMRPLPVAEPQPRRILTLPPPPDSLEPPAAALWVEYGRKAIRDRVLSDVDLLALEALCVVWWRMQVLEDAIAEEGMTYKKPILNGAGEEVGYRELARPQVSMLKDARAEFYRLLQAFGWTPSSRTRVQMISDKGPGGEGEGGLSEAEKLMAELTDMQSAAGGGLPC